jgi:hypothetical protein
MGFVFRMELVGGARRPFFRQGLPGHLEVAASYEAAGGLFTIVGVMNTSSS